MPDTPQRAPSAEEARAAMALIDEHDWTIAVNTHDEYNRELPGLAECAALSAARDTLRSRLAALEADAERLDWLSARANKHYCVDIWAPVGDEECDGRKEAPDEDGVLRGCYFCAAMGGHWQTREPHPPQADGDSR